MAAAGRTLGDDGGWFDGIVGRSRAIRQAIALAERAGQTTATVLLQGETGTGKELFARAIHDCGPRARGPFIVLNCAAVPETLLESELFGHLRGAFTGAERARRGLFEEAHGGTLFLDEVGETSPGVQGKLLRVLQSGEVRPLGSDRVHRVDARVVAATNRDLNAEAAAGRFRADLFYRLSVLPLSLPALRERPEDIEDLALHFLRRLGAQEGRPPPAFGPQALELLRRHPWPGNVRELQNEIRRLVLTIAPGERVEPCSLSPWIGREGGPDRRTDSRMRPHERPLKAIVREAERAAIHERLRRHAYHRAATARSLGVSREWLWAKMRALGIEAPRHTGEVNPEGSAEPA
jgi:transcriptional regulator with PAS, ATPase and Fis domain